MIEPMPTNRGRKPGAQDLVSLQARLPRALHADLVATAAAEEAAGRLRPSLNALMVELLTEALAVRAKRRRRHETISP